MSGEVEAAGAAVTAGLVAAAVDKHGRGKSHGGPCANCGTSVDGLNYCPKCGQPAHIHRSLFHMFEEFLHGIVHFDTRAWKTLPLLLVRPGKLTHDYIHGRRARYISPLAMFLLCVFAMFFVFALTGGSKLGVIGEAGDPRLAGAQEKLTEALDEFADAQREVVALRASPDLRDPEDGPGAQRELEAAQRVAAERRADVEKLRGELEATRAAIAGTPAPPEAVRETTIYEEIRASNAEGRTRVSTGWKKLDEKITHALENPELAVYKYQNAAYKFAFLLAPISLPFIWLMFFWKRGVTLFDHMVFILYSLSFTSLLFITISLVAMIPGVLGYAITPLLLGGLLHAYFHLKGGYALGWFSALWRLPVLVVFAGICMVLFLGVILVLGLGV